MNLRVSYMPHGILYKVIPQLTEYLLKSEAWTAGRTTVDDIVGFVYSGRMMLWGVYDPETLKIYGYVITELKDYPRCKMLVLQYCAGEPNHMKYAEEEMLAVLERFAKENNCAGIEFFGRPGWSALAKKRGYTTKTVVYEKHFEVAP
jgi:hypothetical protein